MRQQWTLGALVIAMLGLCCVFPNQAQATAQDVAFMLDGVKEIGAPGVPGPLCVFGNSAFPVAVGGAAKDVHAPVVAAAYAGKGRIVAFGHGGYFGAETLEVADTGRLMVNVVRWVAGTAASNLRRTDRWFCTARPM